MSWMIWATVRIWRLSLIQGRRQKALTVIDALGERPVILRPGSITAADIEGMTGIAPLTHNATNDAVISPGQLKSHYAPRLPLRLNTSTAGPGTAFIGFGDTAQPDAGFHFNLSPDGDLIEAAAQLYHLLRAADQCGAAEIAMAPIPDEAIGIAINDRLRRAPNAIDWRLTRRD